jgi:hypothetical protein
MVRLWSAFGGARPAPILQKNSWHHLMTMPQWAPMTTNSGIVMARRPVRPAPIVLKGPCLQVLPSPVPVPSLSVYIERALINPSGDDAGREVVVLASLVTTAQTLTNWRLTDKNGRVTPINTTLGPGQSVSIALDANGVQLGNKGGNLILQDDHNAQVDVVTYTAEDASPENRYIRFRR